MENSDQSGKKQKGGPRANVRFSEREYAQLVKDERERGLTIPLLLKEAYFQGRPTAILMTQEEQKTVMTELMRQGNNLNQLARRANAGITSGIEHEIAAIRRVLTGLMALISGKAATARS